MGYPKFSAAAIENKDKYGQHNSIETGKVLMNLTYPVMSQKAVAGVTDTTTNTIAFIMPTKAVVEKARFVISKVQTGTGNTPTVNLYNLTKSEIVAAGSAIALAGSIGDVSTLTLNADNVDIAEGDVLAVQIVNTDGTITVAIEGHIEFDWHSVV